MHKYLGWLLIVLALAGGASAQSIGVGLGVDDITLRPGGGGTGIAAPAVSLNFASGGYSNTAAPTCNSAATCVTTTNSGGMAVDASGTWHSFAANTPRITNLGLTVEESRTNLFLNSQAPATQTITVVSTSVYTVSVYGTASVVLSGAGTGTVTQGNPVTFTASTTSLVCTVSGAGGTFQNVQVELGGFATTPIVTTGASATRAADVVTLTTAPAFGTQYSMFAAGSPEDPSSASLNAVIVEANSTVSNRAQLLRSTANSAAFYNPPNAIDAGAVWNQFALGKAALSVSSPSNRQLVFNAIVATVGSGASAPSAMTAVDIGSQVGGTGQWDGTITQVALWPTTALTAAQLQALTH